MNLTMSLEKVAGPLALALSALALACVQPNPAFDERDSFADDTSDDKDSNAEVPDSDDADDNDNDNDEAPDSDSDDGDPGDGDGDPGDGDGDPGDGDGDPGDGDGDGDGNPAACEQAPIFDDYPPFWPISVSYLEPSNAPNFMLAPHHCHLLVVCKAEQDVCDGVEPYVAKVYSGGDMFLGIDAMSESPLQMTFVPGDQECMGATLELDPNQFVGIEHMTANQSFEILGVRLPCLTEYGVPLYIAEDGSTFWNIELSDPAALWI